MLLLPIRLFNVPIIYERLCAAFTHFAHHYFFSMPGKCLWIEFLIILHNTAVNITRLCTTHFANNNNWRAKHRHICVNDMLLLLLSEYLWFNCRKTHHLHTHNVTFEMHFIFSTGNPTSTGWVAAWLAAATPCWLTVANAQWKVKAAFLGPNSNVREIIGVVEISNGAISFHLNAWETLRVSIADTHN